MLQTTQSENMDNLLFLKIGFWIGLVVPTKEDASIYLLYDLSCQTAKP